eukprot:scaffold2638_cov114-Cylindrotheca_fusiformis.AAC.10
MDSSAMASSSIHHRTAIEFNNIAMSCWRDGDDGFRAIGYLFTSYRHCQHSFKLVENIGGGAIEEERNFDINEVLAWSLECTFSKHASKKSIFYQGIELPAALARNSSSTRLIVLQAIVFNLAMVHHLVAEGNGHDSFQSLQQTLRLKAIEFYHMGLRISDFYSGMYAISILNNLGHLYVSIGDDALSAICFSRMLSGMTRLKEGGEHQQVSGIAVLVEIFAEAAVRILHQNNAAAAA